jgi:hypothetical protein
MNKQNSFPILAALFPFCAAKQFNLKIGIALVLGHLSLDILSASAATITGTIVNTVGTPLATNITFTPLSTPQVNGTNLISSTINSVTSSANGGFTNVLNAGDYKVTIGGAARDSFIITVPTNSGTFQMNTLITSALAYNGSAAPAYEFKLNKGQTNGYASLNINALVPTSQLGSGPANTNNYLRGDGTWSPVSSGNYITPGANTTAQTNNGVVTLNADVSLSLANSKMDKSANLSDVGNIAVARANIGAIRFSSDNSSLDINTPSRFVPSANGDYIGQPFFSKYQMVRWDGVSWNQPMQFPYGIQVYTDAENLFLGGGPNGVFQILNYNPNAYSGFLMKDHLGQERGAFTYCNTGSTYAQAVGRGFNLIESYNLATDPIYFGSGTKAIGGVENGTGDLVWFSGATGAGATTFRVVRSTGEVRSEANVLRVGPGATAGGGHQVIINGYLNVSGFDPSQSSIMDISGATVKLLKLIPANYTTAAAPLLDIGNNATGLYFKNDNALSFTVAGQHVGNFDAASNFNAVASVRAKTLSGTNGYLLPTNSLSTWPTAAASPGQAYIGNSNGTIYILTSLPTGTAWVATNKLAP